MRRTFGALILLSLTVPLVARAQETPRVGPGDRVRVTAPECELEKAEGTLLSIGNDRFSATVGNRDIQCPVQALTQLEVSLGERKWWKATLVGLGIGIGVGAVGWAAIVPESKGGWEAREVLDAWGPAVMWAMASITVGAVTGSVIGRKRGTDDWKEVPLPLVQPSIFVSKGSRLNLGFSIPFRR